MIFSNNETNTPHVILRKNIGLILTFINPLLASFWNPCTLYLEIMISNCNANEAGYQVNIDIISQ